MAKEPKIVKNTIAPHAEVIREPILPDWKDWSLVQLSQEKENFISLLEEQAFENIKTTTQTFENVKEEIQKCIYLEKIRVRQKPWAVDPKDEIEFWDNIKSELVKNPFLQEEKPIEDTLLQRIIKRYAQEIAGTFSIKVFKFAQRFIPFGFATLLNALTFRNFKSLYNHKVHIQDRVQLQGEIDLIRSLAQKGTVVIVPTHFSNLDSIMVGWAIDAIGLPPFIYGAGLNLFNNPILAWFMSRLGAYKVDRRKKNMIYLETLKAYSSLALQRGCHSLFFPGGTRSRHGGLEKNLKMGLLSTCFEAQRINYEKYGNKANKIFIVPLTINYHCVLEAPSLINEYLKHQGQSKYIIDSNNYTNFWTITKYIFKFFKTKSEVVLRFGKPMDIMGNDIDENGNSVSYNNPSIDVSAYFKSKGVFINDPQRDWEYTKYLSTKITQAYLRENVVLTSHIVAFTAFSMLLKKFKKLDLYAILRLSDDDRGLPYLEFQANVEKIIAQLKTIHSNGEVQLSPAIDLEIHEVIKNGLLNLGNFHHRKALKQDKFGEITSEDLRLLYFYHNRLDGYNLKLD